jgi:hypothetical protein
MFLLSVSYAVSLQMAPVDLGKEDYTMFDAMIMSIGLLIPVVLSI